MKNVRREVLTIVMMLILGAVANAQSADLQKIKAAFAEADYTLALENSEAGIASGEADSSVMCMYYAFAGMSAEQLEKYSKALGYYKKAIALKVPILDVYNKSIALSNEMNDYDTYEYALKRQADEFPDFKVDVLMKLASHYYKTKQYESLIKSCDEILAMYPGEVKYIYYKAVAFQHEGKLDDAKTLYKQAISLEPDHKNANMALGVMLYKQGSALHKKETKKYESIAKPTRVDYHDYMKRLDVVKEIHVESLPYLLKAYELKPSENLKAILKNTYKRLGEDEKANAL